MPQLHTLTLTHTQAVSLTGLVLQLFGGGGAGQSCLHWPWAASVFMAFSCSSEQDHSQRFQGNQVESQPLS